MATRSRSTQEKASIPSDIPSGHAGVSPYEKELEDTFRLYDIEKTGKLSIRKLQLAMRTLGFEASIDDVQEIVENTPSLGIHQRKKRQQRHEHSRSSNSRNKAGHATSKDTSTELQTTLIATGTRRSSRATAVASRSMSEYVDPDDDDEFESVYDDDEDIYNDELGDDSGNEDEDKGIEDSYDEPLFTLDDFITMMTPKEDEFAKDEVSRVFQLFDTQGKGTIRLEDLRRVVTKLGLRMTDDELREMIEEADPSGNSGVNEKAFKDLMKTTGFLDGPDTQKH